MSNEQQIPTGPQTDEFRQHRKNIASAIADRQKAQHELFKQLMAMPPEERAKLPPAQFIRLTQDQLRRLLSESGADKVEPSAGKSAKAAGPQKPPAKRLKPKPLRIRSPFYAALRASLPVAVVGGAIAVAAVIFGPDFAAAIAPPPARSIYASQWPVCPRLDAHADGCVYRVEAGLTWQSLAAILQMPKATLRSLNPTIVDPVPDTQIIIWRGRSPLTH
jgi:hypothetical protein